MGGLIIERRRLAVLGGALLLLVGAAPGDRLAFDPSFFAQDACLAPAKGRCVFAGMSGGETSLTASAALIAPDRPAKPQSLLEADLSDLLNFGPQFLVRKASAPAPLPKLTLRAAAPVTCLPRYRHRPDRSICGRAGPRKVR